MPIIPLFALIGQTVSPAQVISRFDHFYKTHPSMSLQIKVHSSLSAYNATGSISVSGPGIRVDVSGGNLGYLLVLNQTDGMEAIPKEKVYAEFGGSEDLGKVPFRLSDNIADLNIDPFLSGSLQRGDGWQSAVRGSAGDVIKSTVKGEEGTTEVEAEVDAEGKLTRVKATHTNQRGSAWIETTYTGYSYNALPASTFAVEPLAGWNAVGLRTASMPIQPQEDAPDRKIVSPDGNETTFKQALKARTVVALLDSEWAASATGTDVLAEVEKQFQDAGVPMIRLLDTPGQKAKGYWSDPNGDLLRGLNAQGSPTFFMFDGKAKLQQAFFAYSPREPEALFKDIRRKLKDLAQK